MRIPKLLTLTGASVAVLLALAALGARLAAPDQRALAFPFVVNDAVAEPSCGPWNRQTNGCDDRVCVGDNGETYCEESCNSGPVYRVKC